MLQRTDIKTVNERGGFSLLDLKQYLQRRGYEGIGYAGMTIGDLEKFSPLIVPVSLSRIDHFVVFRGRVGDRVVLADPAFGNRVMRVDRFERVWEKKVGFVVTRDSDGAHMNRLGVHAENVNVVSDAALRITIR
jgi:predicted double-glycine peptidase